MASKSIYFRQKSKAILNYTRKDIPNQQKSWPSNNNEFKNSSSPKDRRPNWHKTKKVSRIQWSWKVSRTQRIFVNPKIHWLKIPKTHRKTTQHKNAITVHSIPKIEQQCFSRMNKSRKTYQLLSKWNKRSIKRIQKLSSNTFLKFKFWIWVTSMKIRRKL